MENPELQKQMELESAKMVIEKETHAIDGYRAIMQEAGISLEQGN